ncbi:DUF6782 family putative metallopeptidase [Actinomarinicola tropica]|nr:DUF6782 family putative metallopeptidase [Actinomarinicola tropica]
MPTSAPPPPPPVVSATPAGGPSAEDLLRRRVARIAAVVAVVLVGGVAAYSFVSDGGPDHPDEWDPRVVDLVAFVEEERELRFDHPVHIDFLTPEEYSEVTRAGGGMEVEGEEGMDEMYEAASMLRSLGLLEGDVDLGGAFDDLNDTGTLAFYDPLTDRVVVRGTEVDVNLEATLVHELVHALQDQHVDLGRLGDMEDSGEAAAFRAVVEGDASLVESRYVAQLSEGDLTAYEETAMAQADAAFAEEIPGVLVASMGASYVLGEPLVGIVQAEGGWAAVDDLLRDRPRASWRCSTSSPTSTGSSGSMSSRRRSPTARS